MAQTDKQRQTKAAVNARTLGTLESPRCKRCLKRIVRDEDRVWETGEFLGLCHVKGKCPKTY